MLFIQGCTDLIVPSIAKPLPQRRQKSLELHHCPNSAVTAVSSSNRAAERGSKNDGDLDLQKLSGFLSVPCVTFRELLLTFDTIFRRLWNRQE